ncbi:MAG TPA: hypothetical protein VI727_08100 [Candidatus Brocadiaceae bacterium]|nr:hypothetical protein [Candidatus Brocadiaceae bacterium]
MKKHISEVEICDDTKPNHRFGSSCENYHKDDFCLLCGYFMEGDRLYLEIHGSNGALNRVKDIDSSQPYVCMKCAEQFRAFPLKNYHVHPNKLTDFIKEGKK